jgi:hypothetical protein
VPELPGVLAYGQSSEEAIAKAQALALRVLADRLEHGEEDPAFLNISCCGMSQWSSAKAKRVLAALLRIGWSIKRESSSHKILSRPAGLT